MLPRSVGLCSPSVGHAVLLGRDSWMRFNTRSYCPLPPRPQDNRVFGELMLSHHATTGVSAYAIDPTATDGGFHLIYDGSVGVTLSDEPQLLEINLVRSNGSLALTGHYLVDMLPQPGILSMKEHFVPSRRQVLLLTSPSRLLQRVLLRGPIRSRPRARPRPPLLRLAFRCPRR